MIQEIDIKIDHDALLKCYNELNLTELLERNTRQIAVQHRGVDAGKQLTDSCNSLTFDWDLYDPKIHSEPPRRKEILKEDIFNITCDIFKGTYIEEIINLLRKDFGVYRGRFMMMKFKTCLSMHVDETKRIHIPIITNPDAFMVIDDKIFRLEVGKVYITDTTYPHTAVNSGKKDRVHLVFCYDDKSLINT